MGKMSLGGILHIRHTPGFCCSSFLRNRIADTVCIQVCPYYNEVDQLLLLYLVLFLMSMISLLLVLGSSSIRNSGNGCFVSYLVILFILLTWCPIFANFSHIFFVFVRGCCLLITIL